jgi:hypothetical protein
MEEKEEKYEKSIIHAQQQSAFLPTSIFGGDDSRSIGACLCPTGFRTSTERFRPG